MSRFPWEAIPGEDGHFCVRDEDGPLVQGEAERGRREIHVMGDDPLVIDKMFGPLVFMPIRVRASTPTCEWIVEREFGLPEGTEWREVYRIPGQLDSDFADNDEEGPA